MEQSDDYIHVNNAYSSAKSSDLDMLPENWQVCSLCSIRVVKKLV